MCLIDLAYRETLNDPLVRALHSRRVLIVKWAFVLIYHYSVLMESVEATAVKFLSEKSLSRAERVC